MGVETDNPVSVTPCFSGSAGKVQWVSEEQSFVPCFKCKGRHHWGEDAKLGKRSAGCPQAQRVAHAEAQGQKGACCLIKKLQLDWPRAQVGEVGGQGGDRRDPIHATPSFDLPSVSVSPSLLSSCSLSSFLLHLSLPVFWYLRYLWEKPSFRECFWHF